MKRVSLGVALTVLISACVEWGSLGFYGRVLLDGQSSTTVENAPLLPPIELLSFGSDSSIVRLFVVGDWGSGSLLQHAVARAMAQVARTEHPHAVVSTGDNFYPSGVESPDDPLFRERWEEVYRDSALHVPWIIALGNHDHRGNLLAQYAYSRHNQRWYCPGPYYVYTLSAGTTTVAIFVIDTDSLLSSSQNRTRQLRWLDSALQSTPATVCLVVGHHPLRSYGLYSENNVLVEHLKPILDRHRVHAYLCGHEHDIQLITAPDDSFTSVVSGAGGHARRTRYGPHTRFAWTGGGFVYLACCSDSTIVVQVIDRTAQVRWRDTLVHRQGLEPRTR